MMHSRLARSAHVLHNSALRWLALVTVSLVGVRAANAQSSPDSSAPLKRETIRGVVFDSLAFEPLVSAFVVARPSGQSTTTDSLGRFTLLTEGEVREVQVYHDALDRMGMGALGLARPARAENWTNLYVATPSLATLWPQLCESKRPRGTRSVIIMGSARLSDNVTRVAGAKVIVQWLPLVQKGDTPEYESVEVLTDSIGNYVACEVEEYVEPSLIALSSEAQSGVVNMSSDVRPIRRMDLILVPAEAAAQRATVRGKVIAGSGAPLRGFAVTIDGRDGQAMTDVDGTFLLDSVPLGSRMLYVRAIGFTPVGQIVEVVEGENATLTIPVSKTVELEGVRVTEKVVLRRDRSEFELRRRAGLGRFLDSTAIMRAPSVRAAIQMQQVVNVQAERGTEFTILGQNGCRAHIFLDGTASDIEMINRLPRANIASIEFYRSAAFAPPRFVAGMTDTCAVAIFWTKYGLRP